MCSETVPLRLSFSNDLSDSVPKVLAVKHDDVPPRRDTLLLQSNIPDFEFSTSRRKLLEFESSSADELFSNGVILPMHKLKQEKRNSNTTRGKHTRYYGEEQEPPPYMRLPPRPCSPNIVDKRKKERNSREVQQANAGNSSSTSFWGSFSRSRSLNCDTKKSFISSSPPLSRSNSTGSAPNLKRMSSNRQQSAAAKPLQSSLSSSRSILNLYPLQKSSSGKSYGNGFRISPVLNLPTPYFTKRSASFFGLGSFLRVGKAKKSNI